MMYRRNIETLLYNLKYFFNKRRGNYNSREEKRTEQSNTMYV